MPAKVCTSKAEIRVAAPRLFTGLTVLAVSAYGFFLIIPVIIAAVIMSLWTVGFLPLLVPVAAVAMTAFFLPLGFGNPHICRLLEPVKPAAGAKDAPQFVVQLTLCPRLRGGLRGMFEDADDIGWLTVGTDGLSFRGDAVELTVPATAVTSVERVNAGLRGLFIYGARIRVYFTNEQGFEALEFGERGSWLLPTSRRNSRQIYQAIQARCSG